MLPRKQLDALLSAATQNVWPSERMMAFYNAVGRLPFRLGTIAMMLSSPDSVKVVWQAGIKRQTDAALQVIYGFKGRGLLLDALWQRSANCRSVRSRGEFVLGAVKLLLENLDESQKDEITIASLGSGSATQFLAGIAANDFEPEHMKAFLVDLDARTLAAAQERATRLRVFVELFVGSIGQFLEKKNGINLIEMVGLADYFNDAKISRYFRQIRQVITPNGFFLGANISSQKEKDYAHGAVCWPPMYYRSEADLRTFLEEAGFQSIWTGECGLYTVWVAQ
jgi:hypothetical protein